MFETGTIRNHSRKKGLKQISDVGELANSQWGDGKKPQSVEDYRGGKERALKFLVGQVMKETRGKVTPSWSMSCF